MSYLALKVACLECQSWDDGPVTSVLGERVTLDGAKKLCAVDEKLWRDKDGLLWAQPTTDSEFVIITI